MTGRRHACNRADRTADSDRILGAARPWPAALLVATVTAATAMQVSVIGRTYQVPDEVSSPQSAGSRSQPEAAAIQEVTIRGRRGWNLAAPLRKLQADASGLFTLDAEEVDRVELLVSNGSSGGAGTLAGYLWDGTRFGPLPIGASLDAARGVFTWQPGVGFVGAYHFVFLQGIEPAAIRRDVRIVLHPKRSGRVGPQVTIDAPKRGQELVQPFTLTGWAVDLDDSGGPGIELVQVWAHPLTGEPRILLGTATYGGARPDVAELHGKTYRDCGLWLEVNGLAPGVYDLAVVARSTAAGGFVPAVMVRVTVR